ncbi:MAG TPA: sigma-70 family RNA polymerase sigma factor [Terriglobia bacterium]|nr:sigma-70 family RNA polymerase sigma factor [Terriglobia bacterium]
MATVEDEQELWDRLRRGDTEAFGGFYRQHATRLQAFLRRCLGDAKAAEDVAQEAFLELWRHPNGFNPARATLKAYLFGIAAKRAADWWRHRAREESAAASPQAGFRIEAATLIEDALARLEPEPRSLLWLREAEGYSCAELAAMLDIPLGTVKSRLFAAREQLRCIWKTQEKS